MCNAVAFFGCEYFFHNFIWINFSTPPEVLGTYSSPYTVGGVFCSQEIYVDRLDVANHGGLILHPGLDSYADLKPATGHTIIIENGAYCDIVPACCSNPASTPYNNEFTDVATQTLRQINDTDSNNYNTPPYEKTTEFDTLNAHDGITVYPNPFSDKTTIEFSLKEDGSINLFIADMHGKKVADVIHNESYLKGGHVVTFNGSNLASGTYYCIMQTQSSRQVDKIVKIQ